MYKSTPGLLLTVWLLLGATAAIAIEPHTLEDFLRRDHISEIRISPDGAHFATIVPLEDRSILNIINRADGGVSSYVNPGPNVYIENFVWVTNERVLLSVGQKFGLLDTPISTGEIFGTNVDGSEQKMLFGFRGDGDKSGTRIDRGRQEEAFGNLLDIVPGDDDNVLIAVWPWATKSEPYSRVERMNIHTGRRKLITKAPVQRAKFLTDPSGIVRFATGAGPDNRLQTYYRDDGEAEWVLINDEERSHRQVHPRGFSADGKTAYLQVEETDGPDGLYAFDTQTREQTLALRGDYADPYRFLYSMSQRALIGAMYMEGKPVLRYFDRKSADAKVYRTLAISFPGQLVSIDSVTRDGQVALVQLSSDRSPGDYYLFDVAANRADLVFSKSEWIDPRRTAEVQPVALDARDGTKLHGYLTLPPGVLPAKQLPMVVLPHGGPFGVADVWRFDTDTQLLAAHGFAVLQINYRGSGYYGRSFLQAGLREWGQAMQDDLTDATRWAIAEEIADSERICIYGSSYGAYAALMGVIKEPKLYQCAVGYAGVYDMPLMFRRGDIAQSRSGRTFLNDALGDKDLEAISPTRLADRIKVPVFLAAGGADRRAPIDHTESMERALKQAQVPVKTLIFPEEGHGFFDKDHQREYLQELLSFLDRNIGAKEAASAAPQASISD